MFISFHGAMPTLVVGMLRTRENSNMPTTSVGMAPNITRWNALFMPCETASGFSIAPIP
jgi:hypothetical protein